MHYYRVWVFAKRLLNAVAVVCAALVRYTAFMRAQPLRFTIEVAAVSLLAAAPVYLAAKNRGAGPKSASWLFLLLAVKVAVFWAVMEVAGVNAELIGTIVFH